MRLSGENDNWDYFSIFPSISTVKLKLLTRVMKLKLNISAKDVQGLGNKNQMVVNFNHNKGSLNKTKLNNEIGYMNCHTFSSHGYTIVEVERKFNKEIQVTGFNKSFFIMQFMLQGYLGNKLNNRHIDIPECKNIAGFYNLDDFKYAYDRQNVYSRFIKIVFNDETMLELVNKYPDSFSDVYNNYRKGGTFFLNNAPQVTTPEMLLTISQMKNAWLMGNANQVYVESKILELLSLRLQQARDILIDFKQNECKSIDDFEKIHEAKRLLLADLSETPTIPELSRHVGLNECKLKYGFRKVFNQTLFECLFDYKMEYARFLLLDTDKPVLDISYECGYSDPSYFATAFKKKHGVTPKVFRKRA